MSLPDEQSSISHYDEIPDCCLGWKILDVGSSNGYGAIQSRHRDVFYRRDYVGVDIQRFTETFLPIIKCDIFKFDTDCKFDTILLLHTLEHFALDRWEALFQKLDALLEPGGFLVVNVPFNQPAYPARQRDHKGAMFHEVGNITARLLSRYCDFQKYLYVGKHKKHKIVIFRESGERFFRSCLRFIFRVLTHHKYSVIRRYLRFRKPARIVAIYQKKKEIE